MHDPCVCNRVSLASTFVLRLLLNLVAGEPEVVFGHFYPTDPNAGGRVGRGGCNDVLEQGIIILVSLYRNRDP